MSDIYLVQILKILQIYVSIYFTAIEYSKLLYDPEINHIPSLVITKNYIN